MPAEVIIMKLHVLLSLFVVPLAAPTLVVGQQTSRSMQAAPASTSQSSRWTEADKKALLARAQRGDTDAQSWLGTFYRQGWFGKADFQEALKWLRRAAKRGNADAQNELGQMYEDGEGVRQNYAQAARWYRRAAEHFPNLGGAGQGRNNLGQLYLQGLGVPKDYVRAYMWLQLAHNDVDVSCVRSHMNPSQILAAERMATEWKRDHPEP